MRTQSWVMSKHSLWQGNCPYLHADFLCISLPGLSWIIILILLHFLHYLGFLKEFVWQEVWKQITRAKVKETEWRAEKLTLISTFSEQCCPIKSGKFIASYPWRWCWTCPGKWPFWSWWWHCHGCAAPAGSWACWGACPWVHSWTGRDAAAWSGGWGPCCGWRWSCCSPGSESVWKGQGEKVLLLHKLDPCCLRVMDGQLQFFLQTSLFLFKGLLDFDVLKLEPWDPHSEAIKLYLTASQHMLSSF